MAFLDSSVSGPRCTVGAGGRGAHATGSNQRFPTLLMNQHVTIVMGTPLCNSAMRCAGSAAAMTTHHSVVGISNIAAKRMAFGGHSEHKQPIGPSQLQLLAHQSLQHTNV
jgi:hypothetical protein